LCRTLAGLDLPHSCREVVDKGASAVLDEVEAAIYTVAASILHGEGFSYNVPSRAKGNQVRADSPPAALLLPCSVCWQRSACMSAMQLYVPELDRIVLREATSQRPFASTSTCRKAGALKPTNPSFVHCLSCFAKQRPFCEVHL
jgi:meiotic recombination protein SPO11